MIKPAYSLEDFDFDLPESLIPQFPEKERDTSKLLILDKRSGSITHSSFSFITDFLKKNDLLVFNNAKVIHARIYCRRSTGSSFEIVLTRRLDDNRWQIISNRTKRLKPGEIFYTVKDEEVKFRIISKTSEFIEVESNIILDDGKLSKIGEIPLPPYIKRTSDEFDSVRYQTIYASESGAVAAPTAGLHFTGKIMEDIKEMGIESVFLTLYVSWGTFAPVRENDITAHKMHREGYFISEDSAQKINNARNSGRRIISVGTTSLRVLEATFKNDMNSPGSGDTDIFIYPPYEIKSCSGLLTNFHTPKSTLLMLVSAFAGYDNIRHAYAEAIEKKYRFFSYGDAMLII